MEIGISPAAGWVAVRVPIFNTRFTVRLSSGFPWTAGSSSRSNSSGTRLRWFEQVFHGSPCPIPRRTRPPQKHNPRCFGGRFDCITQWCCRAGQWPWRQCRQSACPRRPVFSSCDQQFSAVLGFVRHVTDNSQAAVKACFAVGRTVLRSFGKCPARSLSRRFFVFFIIGRSSRDSHALRLHGFVFFVMRVVPEQICRPRVEQRFRVCPSPKTFSAVRAPRAPM